MPGLKTLQDLNTDENNKDDRAPIVADSSLQKIEIYHLSPPGSKSITAGEAGLKKLKRAEFIYDLKARPGLLKIALLSLHSEFKAEIERIDDSTNGEIKYGGSFKTRAGEFLESLEKYTDIDPTTHLKGYFRLSDEGELLPLELVEIREEYQLEREAAIVKKFKPEKFMQRERELKNKIDMKEKILRTSEPGRSREDSLKIKKDISDLYAKLQDEYDKAPRENMRLQFARDKIVFHVGRFGFDFLEKEVAAEIKHPGHTHSNIDAAFNFIFNTPREDYGMVASKANFRTLSPIDFFKINMYATAIAGRHAVMNFPFEDFLITEMDVLKLPGSHKVFYVPGKMKMASINNSGFVKNGGGAIGTLRSMKIEFDHFKIVYSAGEYQIE